MMVSPWYTLSRRRILAGSSRKQRIDADNHDVASPTAVEATGHTGNECRSDGLGLLCSISFRPFNLQLPWHHPKQQGLCGPTGRVRHRP